MSSHGRRLRYPPRINVAPSPVTVRQVPGQASPRPVRAGAPPGCPSDGDGRAGDDCRDLTAGVTGRSEVKPDSGQQGWPAAWGPHLLQELPAEPITSTVRSL